MLLAEPPVCPTRVTAPTEPAALNDSQRALARAVCKVQEDERRRLSRELHDGIGQTLTAVVNQLQRIADDARAHSNLGLTKRLNAALDLTRGALADTRELSRLLRPTLLDDLGLEAALGWLVRTFGERGRTRIELDSRLGEQRLDPDLETVVFRITQEALSNALRHANARQVRVRLSATRSTLRLDVRDDGCGFDLQNLADPQFAAMHLGIRGMRDRAELFGANLELQSGPGQGTWLRLSCALPAEPHCESHCVEIPA